MELLLLAYEFKRWEPTVTTSRNRSQLLRCRGCDFGSVIFRLLIEGSGQYKSLF
jgi:hypothetical protein